MIPSATQSLTGDSATQRHFIDWNRSLIPAAATWLIESAARANALIDLQQMLCVVSGRRAGRLLLKELFLLCRARDAALLPPTICTPGQATDELLGNVDCTDDRALADQWSVELAWLHALCNCDDELLRPLFPTPPERDDLLNWHELASTIASLHETLAGGQLRFADVVDRAQRLEMFQEGDRWHALAVLHQRYRDLLAQHQLIDRHDRRVNAIRAARNAPTNDRAITLIGVVELNQLQRDVLHSSDSQRITALVHAPHDQRDRFDDLGCVRPGAWSDVSIDDRCVTLQVVDRPIDQAQQVLRTLASLSGSYPADQIIIGLGDASLATPIARAARWAGLDVHDAAGKPAKATTPGSVLPLLADWLADRSARAFAALLRCPDIERWLGRHDGSNASSQQHWLSQLDSFLTEHLPQRLSARSISSTSRFHALRFAVDAVEKLLEPLNNDAAPCNQWCAAFRLILGQLYDPALETSPQSISATHRRQTLELIQQLLASIDSANHDLQPIIDAPTFLRLLQRKLQDDRIPENLHDNQIEMLGWLELHADPAPVLILTGVNDGNIPSTATADIFLPDTFCRALGLPNNDSRYARDAYYLQAAQHCRSHVTLIAGRRSTDDEPLTPSRLLLAGDDQLLVERARLLFDDPPQQSAVWPAGLPQAIDETQFVIPDLPETLTAPSSMSASAFRAYLACPYRFALQYLLRLNHSFDNAVELDALQFGSMLHRVLHLFGDDQSLRQLTDENVIRSALLGILDDVVTEKFSRNPPVIVRVQTSMMRLRLIALAKLQARLRSTGWETIAVELSFKDNVQLDVPGQEPMPLHGIIDRIDYHADSRTFRIIDYKSGETSRSPHTAHHGRKTLPSLDDLQWIDLQLPLYHYIAHQADVATSDAVELGYINLPHDSSSVQFDAAQWTGEHLEHGIEQARDIVRRIRAGVFDRNLKFSHSVDDFARLCHAEFFASYSQTEPAEGDDEQ